MASPALVVSYALAGTVNIDFETDPIGTDANGNNVFLRDIWPSRDEIQSFTNQFIKSSMFKENYEKIAQGTERWNALNVTASDTYAWKSDSTYIHAPPYFDGITQ